MIFAYATDDRTLMGFPNEAEALAYCEGIDVKDGNWLFFDGSGDALQVMTTTPDKNAAGSTVSGVYVLRPAAGDGAKNLLSLLEQVVAVEGQPPFNSISGVRKFLVSHSRPTRH